MKTYSEMIKYQTFSERFRYLQMPSKIGIETFGYERYINQAFYHSAEWHSVRDKVIVRDEGCDLGILDRPIYKHIRVHHMNPISTEDFERERFQIILDPACLVCVSFDTHNAIHYGTEYSVKIPVGFRRKGDTTPWIAS